LKPLSLLPIVTIVRALALPLAMIELSDPVNDLSRAQ